MDLKANAVAMLAARCDYLDATTGNPMIVGFRRSISLLIRARAASDEFEPSNVISGAICIPFLSAFLCLVISIHTVLDGCKLKQASEK